MSGKKFMPILLVSFLWMACAEEKGPQPSPKVAEKPPVKTEPPVKAEPPAKAECTITFPKSGLCLSWSWGKKPMSKDEHGVLTFKTYRLNPDQTPSAVDLKNPQVVPWMEMGGHGHPSSVKTQTTRVDVGVYKTSDVVFTMPGKWKLLFKEVSDTNELIDEAQVELTVF